MVLGSDGLWDTLSPQAVIRLVHDTVKQPAMCAKRLVSEAMQNGEQAMDYYCKHELCW